MTESRSFLVAILAAVTAIVWGEALRFDADGGAELLTGWLCRRESDFLPFAAWFALLPVLWLLLPAGRVRASRRTALHQYLTESRQSPASFGSLCRAWAGAVTVVAAALGMSRWAGSELAGLPPALHDEYSYLFQVETFALGRTWVPSFPGEIPDQTSPTGQRPAASLFDQKHVLNEGRFASRYFPGTGMWMLPFFLSGHVWWGHQLAQAWLAFFTYWTGRDLGNLGTGLLAGLLVACSPGLVLFSNLLLAHHPTLVGLSLFLWAFLRFRAALIATASQQELARGDQAARPDHARLLIPLTYAVLAGLGLSFAMLCRPMTAAGFALPMGLWTAAWLVAPAWTAGTSTALSAIAVNPVTLPPVFPDEPALWERIPAGAGATAAQRTVPESAAGLAEPAPGAGQPPGLPFARGPQRLMLAVALGGPLVLGWIMLFLHNQSITGNGWQTPYQLYTDIYTPRHVYGFNNVVRGEQHLGPKVLDHYDRWADNLTPALAVQNVMTRAFYCGRWTLGVVLVLFVGVWTLATRRSGTESLLLCSVISLHAVHIPYWFTGIMGWHYVLESAPVLLLLTALASQRISDWTREIQRPGLLWWWRGLIVLSVAVGTVTLRPLWPGQLWFGEAELRLPRQRYAQFSQEIDRLRAGRPAVVLVIPDPDDRHMDLVTNAPTLDGPVLRVRFDPRVCPASAIAALFPERLVLIHDARSHQTVIP